MPELVNLLKIGSPKAQEMAAAGISDLALGAVQEREARGDGDARERVRGAARVDELFIPARRNARQRARGGAA